MSTTNVKVNSGFAPSAEVVAKPEAKPEAKPKPRPEPRYSPRLADQNSVLYPALRFTVVAVETLEIKAAFDNEQHANQYCEMLNNVL